MTLWWLWCSKSDCHYVVWVGLQSKTIIGLLTSYKRHLLLPLPAHYPLHYQHTSDLQELENSKTVLKISAPAAILPSSSDHCKLYWWHLALLDHDELIWRHSNFQLIWFLYSSLQEVSHFNTITLPPGSGIFYGSWPWPCFTIVFLTVSIDCLIHSRPFRLVATQLQQENLIRVVTSNSIVICHRNMMSLYELCISLHTFVT